MTRRPIAALAAASLCAVFVLAACSTGSGGTNASPSAAAGGATIALVSSAAGNHLAGPNGKALYVFAHDTANTSTCTGSCSDNWPALTVTAGQSPAAGTGVSTQLATLTRSDGTLQVTANGLPLYYFAGDASGSDTKGQGIGGIWFLAGADGKALSGGAPAPGAATPSPASSPATSSSPAPTSSGYSDPY